MKYLYRYEEDDDLNAYLVTYEVVRESLCDFLVLDSGALRSVSKFDKRPLAYDTKAAAKRAYLRSKHRQIQHAHSVFDRARRIFASAENDDLALCLISSGFAEKMETICDEWEDGIYFDDEGHDGDYLGIRDADIISKMKYIASAVSNG